jgi:hypothetical protein
VKRDACAHRHVVYDLWTRSMLANGQRYPSLNSYAARRMKMSRISTDEYAAIERRISQQDRSVTARRPPKPSPKRSTWDSLNRSDWLAIGKAISEALEHYR